MERSAVSLGPTALAARDRLLDGLAAGRPGPGERLGAERELAERLGVSRSTIRAALADLERSGVVRRSRGRGGGIFVAERKIERDLTSLAGLPAYLRRQGFQSDARVLSTATVEADGETAAALGLSEPALVLEVVRVRLADGDPISLERALFPADRFPDLLDRSLGGSLYELLETHYGLVPGEAEERIEVVAAGTAEAQAARAAPRRTAACGGTDRVGRGRPRVRALARPVPRRPRPHRRARPGGACRGDAGRRRHPRPRGRDLSRGRTRDHARRADAPALGRDARAGARGRTRGRRRRRDRRLRRRPDRARLDRGGPPRARLRRDLPARGADRRPRRATGRCAGRRGPRLRAARLGLGLRDPRASGCSRARSSRSRSCGSSTSRRATGRRSPPA